MKTFFKTLTFILKKSIYKIKLKFIRILRNIKSIYRSLTSTDTMYRIDEINAKNGNIILYCHGTHAVIKTTLAEVIWDMHTLSSLSPIQACWIGYYYGKLSREFVREGKNLSWKKNKMNFLLVFKKGRFKIISLDRLGNITYLDTKSKKTHTESPIVIAQNEFSISQFDSSQACYVGLLAGTAASKQNQTTLMDRKVKPVLTIVK